MLFGWGSPKLMRRGLPNREMVMLERFYEDYMYAMYPPVPGADEPSEEDLINEAPWESDTIVGGPT